MLKKVLLVVLGTCVMGALVSPPVHASQSAERTAERRYEAPGLIHGTYVGVVTFASNQPDRFIGFVFLDAEANETRASFRIDDALGQKVAGRVIQNVDGDRHPETDVSFCGSTEGPIPIVPAQWLTVYVHQGPCADGTPAIASRGTVTATFFQDAP